MVWARTKLLIWDYVFEPVKAIEMNFVGKHPERYYKKMHELIRSVFNVPDAYIQEKSYNWEKLKDTERFDIAWEVTKILDVYSYITVILSLKGVSTGGEGRISIKIQPRLITEYPQDTVWQQNILYEMVRRFWHKAFYHNKRMQYLNYAKELIVGFERSVKEFAESLREE
ncbi:hypothetical protein ACFLQN_04510 [Candidatus Aenigmatarchaeota archaeon]